MCGIVGYVGARESANILVSGLRRLEYRGYDSAGIAVQTAQNKVEVLRCRGKLDNLALRLKNEALLGQVGIGHTRWATHGRPSDENAHPHFHGGVAVVHNGIIENHLELRAELRASGHQFTSETDTEIFAHLIADEQATGKALLAAVRGALERVRGTYALAVISEKSPGQIVAAKNASPLVLGLGKGEQFVASDVPALLEHTRDVIFLEEGETALIERDQIRLYAVGGAEIHRASRRVDWTPLMAEKGGHKHFMHKEIHEQPQAVADTIRGRASSLEGDVHLGGLTLGADEAKALQKALVLACGTSHHAGLVGKIYLETLARLPVETDLASEFRYREPLVPAGTLAIAISQSGETADTLAAIREARRQGARTLAVCNVVDSAIPRDGQDVVYTHAGPEIGVASTKCFTTQLAALFLLGVRLGRLRGTLEARAAQEQLTALRQVPQWIEQILATEPRIAAVARRMMQARDVLFLGRGPQFPVALEGALKLKEISYIHAEGYAAGEMKHGPIALIDSDVPVVVLATKGPGYDKILGNIEEARARGGQVIAICGESDTRVPQIADEVLRVPDAPPLILPLLTVVPLQLLAYHIADLRGTDVDQPRNLAKSVTVE
ncbi:MAG: glutamine--fructose-6-phosphate transaminase (isomerizing) [Deltaproteobacteria bacterium]